MPTPGRQKGSLDEIRRGATALGRLDRGQHDSPWGASQPPRDSRFSRDGRRSPEERHQFYRALMRGRAGPIIVEQIRQIRCEIVRAELTGRKSSARMRKPEFAAQFIVGAYRSIVNRDMVA